jgi:flavin reductase (DIM6/NTAB) family NADH-FMN oxidoreductase RutF
MARENFRPGTLHAPLPAVMVSVGNMEKSNIITVAWTGILSSDPARTYVSVRPSRYSHSMIKESGEFVINLTTEALAKATDYAGIYTGAKVDKFDKLGLTRVESKCVSAPTIKESPLALECRVVEVLSMGTHDVFIADIVNVSCDEQILDKDGRIRLDKANLIAYAHGEYFELGRKLGVFGFSAAKKSKSRKNTGSGSSLRGNSKSKSKSRLGAKKASKQ